MKTYTLENGIQIPSQGLGTWQVDDETAARVVKDAIEVGYRHIDTAEAYQNEEGVGRGIQESGMPRQQIFLTTKIMPFWKDYESAEKAVDGCLERLGTDYVDLMLIHAPRPFDDMFVPSGKTYNEENVEVWRALEDAYKAGKAKAIGLSNFQIEDIDNILAHCTVKPAVNQILVNITHYPKVLMEYCREKGILVEAYSPNATGKLKGDVLRAMAEKYHCSLPQLGNKFDLQLGCVVLPKTTHKEYMESNLNLDFFKISEEDMAYLESVGQYEGWKGSDSD